jgi:hypothetical protein
MSQRERAGYYVPDQLKAPLPNSGDDPSRCTLQVEAGGNEDVRVNYDRFHTNVIPRFVISMDQSDRRTAVPFLPLDRSPASPTTSGSFGQDISAIIYITRVPIL